MSPTRARQIHLSAVALGLVATFAGVYLPWQYGNHFTYAWGRRGSDELAHYCGLAVLLLGAWITVTMLLGWRKRIIAHGAAALCVLFSALGLVGGLVARYLMRSDDGTDPEHIARMRYSGYLDDVHIHPTLAPWLLIGGLLVTLVAGFAIWQSHRSEVDEMTR